MSIMKSKLPMLGATFPLIPVTPMPLRTLGQEQETRCSMTKKSLGLLWACFVVSLAFLLSGQSASAQKQVAPFKDFPSYVKWMQKNHRAPFDRDGAILPHGGAHALMKAQAVARAAEAAATATTKSSFRNTQVTQDRNPWPKAEVAAAVDPTAEDNWVVMTNDFRRNFDQMFFHVSTNKGQTWTDDAMVGGSDPFTGFIPSTFQSDPGLSFDSSGNSYLSTITGNLLIDFNNGYENVDTEIDVAQGFAHGTYASLLPTPIDVQPCNGLIFTGPFSCDATLDKPLITTDSNPGSSNNGTTYVYYTLFCNSPASGFCVDGNATVPAFQSAILESHSPGPGQPFSAPELVSGTLVNAQFSDLVIDAGGTPHMFFDDFTNFPTINMWMSSLIGGNWAVSATPVASFTFNGLTNMNWSFRDNGAEAPGCGIHDFIAYCAFSANRVGSGRPEATPSVYLATIHTQNGISHIVRVNNDPFNDQKHHFFAWATASPAGNVYVGFYDDRNDPFNTKVDYFVAKSTDGGKTFPTQHAVNDVSFNPCVGFPFCGFFGDYTQLVSGPNGVVHAAWSDTRDGASMQIWSQAVTF
jgi:hypothetical protein